MGRAHLLWFSVSINGCLYNANHTHYQISLFHWPPEKEQLIKTWKMDHDVLGWVSFLIRFFRLGSWFYDFFKFWKTFSGSKHEPNACLFVKNAAQRYQKETEGAKEDFSIKKLEKWNDVNTSEEKKIEHSLSYLLTILGEPPLTGPDMIHNILRLLVFK